MKAPILVALVASLLPINAFAQEPRISGTWTMDATRSASAAQAAPITSATLLIKLRSSEISIETRENSSDRTVNYKLDGTESVSKIGTDSATGRMKWDGQKLQTDTVYNMRETALAQTATYTVSENGRELTVKYDMRVLHGYEGKKIDNLTEDPNYSSGTDVFVRR